MYKLEQYSPLPFGFDEAQREAERRWRAREKNLLFFYHYGRPMKIVGGRVVVNG